MHAKKLISACTNSASGTHRALVGAKSKCHLHIEQPAGLAQHADTPSAQVQTLRASRSMRACCGLHAGVSACCAKSRTQAKRDPCARGVGAYPSPRPRGGAIGVRAGPSRVSAPPQQARMLREARSVCTCALGVSACCANPAGCSMCR